MTKKERKASIISCRKYIEKGFKILILNQIKLLEGKLQASFFLYINTKILKKVLGNQGQQVKKKKYKANLSLQQEFKFGLMIKKQKI